MTNQSLERINLLLLPPDLFLLLFDGVDERGRDLRVFDAFYFSIRFVFVKQRFDLIDFLGDKTDIALTVRFPIEGDGTQPGYEIETAREIFDVSFVANAR